MAAPYHGVHTLLARYVGPIIPITVFFIYYAAYSGAIPGLDVINTTIYFATGFLFIPSFLQAARTTALTDIRKSGISDYYVFSNRFNRNREGNEDTWAGLYDKTYRISFYGLEQGLKNGQDVLKTMKTTPRIIWIRPGTWSVFALALLVFNIVIFACLGDAEHGFFFYLPSLLALACPVLSFVFVRIRDNILYDCATRIVAERKKEMAENVESGTKWYHNICPKCGAKYAASILHCISCGSSLEVIEGDRSLNSIRRIRIRE